MKKRRQMTLELLEEMMKRRISGESYPKIAESLNVSVRNTANYLRTIERMRAGKEPLKGDHVSMELIYQLLDKLGGAEEDMEKGVKMTPREVERIVILTGAGKTVDQIAEEINRSRNTVTNYITAIRQAAKGTFVHQSSSGVRMDLIEPYIRKEGKAKEMEKELMRREVRMAGRPEPAADRNGMITVDEETALMISGEIEAKTPMDIITRLMRVDMATVNRIKTYIGFLKSKENDQTVEWKKNEVFLPEVFSALEAQFSFFPKERSPEDQEEEFRKSVLANQELTHDLLNSIDDLLRKVVKWMEGKSGTAEGGSCL